MRNSIILSVFMLAGLFITAQLAAQDSKACASKTEKVSCVKAETACVPASKTTATSHAPFVLHAAMTGTSTSSAIKPNCKPADCAPADLASANCDPALCKKTGCDPADCPPECKPLCGTAASVSEKAEVKEVKCQPAHGKAKVALADSKS